MFVFLRNKEDNSAHDNRDPLQVGLQLFNLTSCRKCDEPILTTVGQGRIHEEQAEYEEAIQLYEKAERLTWQICGDRIRELQEEFPSRPSDWDWLYLRVIRRRVRVCRRELKKLDD